MRANPARPRALVPARSYEPELLDLPGNSYHDLAAMLRELERINRWLGGTASVRRPIEALVRRDRLRAYTLLDVGTGGGENPRAVIASARRAGIDARAVGCDLDPHIVRYAAARGRESASREAAAGAARGDAGLDPKAERPGAAKEPAPATPHSHPPALALLRSDGFRLPFPDDAFDFVISALMFHHFDEAAAARLLAEMARVARRAVVVNDLVRHRVPWAVIALLARLRHSRLVMHDGPLSVLRGWTPGELLAVADAAGFTRTATVRRLFPYRVVLVVERGRP